MCRPVLGSRNTHWMGVVGKAVEGVKHLEGVEQVAGGKQLGGAEQVEARKE